MTVDRKRLILSCVHWDQFIFLIAEDDPMRCPRMDHFGLAVGSLAELEGVAERAKAFREHDDRVDLIDVHMDDQGPIKIHSLYVKYILPMMCELQYWEFVEREGRPTRWRRSLRFRRLRPPGVEARVHADGRRPDAWARSVELARLAEQLGYDHLWVYDHVETVPRREPTHCLRGVHHAGGAVPGTTTIRLGQLVTCASYRNAGLLAKEAACIDVYSGGRLILGLGAGWFGREYEAYGYPFLATAAAPAASSTKRSR